MFIRPSLLKTKVTLMRRRRGTSFLNNSEVIRQRQRAPPLCLCCGHRLHTRIGTQSNKTTTVVVHAQKTAALVYSVLRPDQHRDWKSTEARHNLPGRTRYERNPNEQAADSDSQRQRYKHRDCKNRFTEHGNPCSPLLSNGLRPSQKHCLNDAPFSSKYFL